MALLVYSAIASLDGYVTDASGDFDWAEPDETVHTFVNDLERQVGTYLFGRRMYEVMSVWQTLGTDPGHPAYIQDYGRIWRAADKVVYSKTLESASTPRTRIEREFDPEAVRRMKASAVKDLSIGGPTIAATAIRAGLVDEYMLFVAPVAVGGGLPFLPPGLRLDLTLVEERSFPNGMVCLRYRDPSTR